MIHIVGLLLFGGALSVIQGREKALQRKNRRHVDSPKASVVPGHDDATESAQSSVKNLLNTRAIANESASINHYCNVSYAGFGLTLAGKFLYPPLTLLSVPALAYTSIPIFKAAYASLIRQKKPHISLLDSAAIVISIGGGLYLLAAFATGIYFTSVKLLDRTKNKSRNILIDAFSEQPPSVCVLRDGVELMVPLGSLRKGDLVVVRAGEIIPADGFIEAGIASIDEHMLTGESTSAEKNGGDKVFALTLVLAGRIVVSVEKAGAETIVAHIAEILNTTENYEALLQTRGEKWANRTVLPTIGIAGASLVTAGLQGFTVALSSNFSEVMRTAAPLSMLNYLRLASRKGLLIKDGRSLELLRQVDTIVFDKTGTLTLDQPHVGRIHVNGNVGEQQVLHYAAQAEYKQSHPVAKAILSAANAQGLIPEEIDDARYHVGYGIEVELKQKRILVGSNRFMQQKQIEMPKKTEKLCLVSEDKGYSLIYVAVNDVLQGVLEIRPSIREEAKTVINSLQQRGLDVYILSGDHEKAVQHLASELNIQHYIAETLPEDKANVIETLQQKGKSVCFIGDGINDAIALKKAAVSVSLQDASRIATDAAQILLMDKDLSQLLEAFDLAEAFAANQRLGIGSAVVPSVLCMGGALFFHFSLLGTLVFYNISALLGMGSAMLPLLSTSKPASKKNVP